MGFLKVHDINYVNGILFKRKSILSNKLNRNMITQREYDDRTELIDDLAHSFGLKTNITCLFDCFAKQFRILSQEDFDKESALVKFMFNAFTQSKLRSNLRDKEQHRLYKNELQIVSATMEYQTDFKSL